MNQHSDLLHIQYVGSLGQGLQSLHAKINFVDKRPHQGALKSAKNSSLSDFNQIWWEVSPSNHKLDVHKKKCPRPFGAL